MKTKFVFAAIVAICLATSVAFAQTPGEALQRAIFAQDAQGNIDGAIQGYRQVATSTFASREVAAHAQYRLSQALLLKGDLPAATRELERLKKDFAEYGSLITNLTESVNKASPAVTRGGPVPVGLSSQVRAMVAEILRADSEVGPMVTLRGTVVSFIRGDEVYAIVEAEGRRHAVVLGDVELAVSKGARAVTGFKFGETVTVDARHPFSQPVSADGIVGLRAQTITRADGSIAFKR